MLTGPAARLFLLASPVNLISKYFIRIQKPLSLELYLTKGVRFMFEDYYNPCCRSLQKLFYAGSDLFHLGGRLEAGYYVSAAVNDELGEVPLDVGIVLVILVDLR